MNEKNEQQEPHDQASKLQNLIKHNQTASSSEIFKDSQKVDQKRQKKTQLIQEQEHQTKIWQIQQKQQVASSQKSLKKVQSNDSSNNSLVLHIEVSQIIPSQQFSMRSIEQKYFTAKIPMYHVSSFIKMETQRYIIDLHDPYEHEDYQIQRRFSDFVDLYEMMFYNHPGHILYPFPDKNFETFFKLKLGIGINQPGQKCELIEKRMAELEQFLNYLTHHSKACEYDEIKVFIQRQNHLYLELKVQLLQILRVNQSMQNISYMHNIKQKSKTLWSFIRKQKPKQKQTNIIKINKRDIQFSTILETVRSKINSIQALDKLISKLYEIEEKAANFTDIETDNDILLKTCAKNSSARQYSKLFSNHIYIAVQKVRHQIKFFKEIQKILTYRIRLCEVVDQLKKNNREESKRQKIIMRIETLENNFLPQWQQFVENSQKRILQIQQQLHLLWRSHKKKMKKIWKKSSK